MTPESAPPTALPPTDAWRPLPARARALFMLALAPGFVLPLTIVPAVFAAASDSVHPLPVVLAGAATGLVLAAWRGHREFRCLAWRHDEQGLAVRRGALWQRETRVPASRVQHLDLRRGPLQRRRGLSTLVVHTAGSRSNTVALPNLDWTEAEALRDVLSRQADDVDG